MNRNLSQSECPNQPKEASNSSQIVQDITTIKEEQFSDGSDDSDGDFLYYDDDDESLIEEESQAFPKVPSPNWKQIQCSQTPSWLEGYQTPAGPKSLTLTYHDKPID